MTIKTELLSDAIYEATKPSCLGPATCELLHGVLSEGLTWDELEDYQKAAIDCIADDDYELFAAEYRIRTDAVRILLEVIEDGVVGDKSYQ